LDSPELFILATNATLLVCAYLFVYPRFAGADLSRLALNDLVATGCALGVAAYAFAGTGQRFNLLVGEVGWFGFTFTTFVLMELPLLAWYARRHGLVVKDED
jgi:hypothetical protein